MVLLGITHTDNQIDIDYLAKKILNIKLFKDDEEEEKW
jgi:D-Tyr-tRNAtyr deacylase